jgi:UDP-N-acetylglucosamine/UDP-N-acetyl-alpha-D-glucosaminouronate 4-epimerase
VARFLVTGGAGFIGSHLVHALAANGDAVRVLDDLSSGYLENLEDVRSRIELVEGDVSDRAAVARAMSGVGYVLHHAALASVPRSIDDPWLNHRINVDGTLALLMAAREAGVRRFVLASSAAVYGDGEETPKREDMPPRPVSPYATSKLIGEHYCGQFTACGWVPAVCLRYFNIFGPRQDPGSDYAAVVPIFVNTLLEGRAPVIHGDGEQTRDFTYIDNVVHANLLAVSNDAAVGGVFNIGCGGSYTVNALYDRVASSLAPGVRPEHAGPRAGDVRASEASIERARRDLGYEPVVGFEEGLDRTCRWFRANPERARRSTSA